MDTSDITDISSSPAYTFLEELFREVSQRGELRDQRFDRRDATETLKIYLGRT